MAVRTHLLGPTGREPLVTLHPGEYLVALRSLSVVRFSRTAHSAETHGLFPRSLIRNRSKME